MFRTRNTRTGRAAALVAGLLLAALAAGCGKDGSPPVKGPKAEALPVYQVDTGFELPDSRTWTKAKKRGYLVVGAKEDQPYLGEKDPASGIYSGFDIEIARMMSASLGFDPKTIRFRTIASANRETALQNGQIDYYVGTYTINDMRKKLVGFAGPYYMAGQGLLVRTDENDINGPQDLAGKTVCSAASTPRPTSGSPPTIPRRRSSRTTRTRSASTTSSPSRSTPSPPTTRSCWASRPRRPTR